MNSYLKAIGFSRAFESERDVDVLLDNLFHTFDERKVVKEKDGRRAYLEFTKSFGPNIGICVCGEMDSYGFHRTGYFPYLIGSGVTTDEEISIEKRSDGAGYMGMADEGRVGVSLIFFLQNSAAYRKRQSQSWLKDVRMTTTLAALSSDGMILLPVKEEDRRKKETQARFYERHDSLVSSAKNGNQEAIESLTMEEMDTYAMINRRVLNEDVLSIVDTYFMPYGLETDQYQIMGTIHFYTKVRNTLTKEYLYQMTLDCNGMVFDLCINAKDLLGEPEVGRRFKGNVWLQGRINYGDGAS